MKKKIAVAMERSGYTEIIDDYLAQYDKLAAASSNIAKAATVSASFTNVSADVISAVKTEHFSQFEFLNTEAQAELHRILLNATIVGKSPSNTISELQSLITGEYPWGDRMGLYSWHAGTYVRTMEMQASRAFMNDIAFGAGMEFFLYVGPVDSVTRDFCLSHVGRVYSRAEIEDMDNGQTENVFTDGGGWNCRHTWSPVPADFARFMQGELSRAEIKGLMAETFDWLEGAA
jgi:hypothetical protein